MENNIIESALTSGLVPSPQDAPAIRWGIIGAGWISSTFAQAVTNHTASTIAAVASRDVTKAQAFIDENLGDSAAQATAYGSYEELVADPTIDAVYVGTPHSHHRDHALLAINAGKHVLVEKAFTRNGAEAREVLDAAKEKGVFVMEAMWTRFLPHIVAAQDLVARGEIGDVITVIADHGQHFPFNPQHRLYNIDLAGGALLDLGVYPVAFAHDFLGKTSAITARGELTETKVDGQISMVFEYEGRAQASLHTTLWARTPVTASVIGTEGRIDIADTFYAPSTFTLRKYSGEVAEYKQDDVFGLEFEAAEVARCIAAGKTQSDRMSWDDTLAIIDAMDEIRRQVGVVYPGE